MLERLFTSRVKRELLKLLLFSPGKKFQLRQVSRLVKANPTHVKQELNNLSDAGLVLVSKQNTYSLFEVNEKSAVYKELKVIFLKTDVLGNYLCSKLRAFNLKFALIYGSFAEGIEKPESDIDLLLIGEADEKKLAEIISKAEQKINREINYVIWSEQEFRERIRKKIPLLADIAKHKIIPLIGEENEFRRIIKRKPG